MSANPSRRATLEWGRGSGRLEKRQVNSAEGLDAVLMELQGTCGDEPLIVVLSIEDRGSLFIGLGRDRTVLGYTPADLDPPYLHSVGEQGEGKDLVFFLEGHWTDFPARYGVPLSEGLGAMRGFFDTCELSSNISWEKAEVIGRTHVPQSVHPVIASADAGRRIVTQPRLP